MVSTKMKTLRLGLILLGTVTALAAAPAAQVQQNVYREDAGTALTRHLRTLSEEPRSVSALIGAGKAALELGDPQAALTFFARAEEIAPRDGHVKAGMGSAFVAMEEPRTALRLFTEAASFGIPEYEFAGDRGLIHDLAGDPRRAQADYSLALSRREDDEVRRRLALSLAISGERDKALATIDAQLRRQDRAAWRTRAFILALAGDARGATQVAQSTLPAQAAELQPFFARLSSLSPAQRAMAVHFGHFPEGAAAQAASTQYTSAAPAVTAARVPVPTEAGRPDRGQAAFGVRRNPGQSRSSLPSNAAPAQAEPRRARPSASDWAQRYGRPSAADTVTRPPRTTSQKSQPSTSPITTASVPGAGAAPQPTSAGPLPAGRTNLGALVQNLPVDGSAAASPSVSPTQNQLARLAEARPAPTATTPPAAQSTPAAASPSGSPPQAQPAQLAEARPTPLTATPPAAQPAADAPAPQLEAAAQAPSSSSIASLTLPPSEPARRTVANVLAQQPPADLPEQQPSARSFADIAAAISSLPGEPGASATTASPQPEQKVFARLEPNATPAAPAPRTEPKVDPPKPAAPTKSKAEAPKAAAAKAKEAPAKEAADKAGAKKDAAKKDAAAKKEPPVPKEPSRHWVQVAGGANEAAMTNEFNRLKVKAPKLLGSRTAWTTPLRATNRLLVGPFKTPKEAQDFVNELAKLDLSAFSWTSPAGQEIVKLSAK